MDQPSPRPRVRVFVDDRLEAGATIAASPQQSHYLMRVRRIPAGASVALFNGADGEWTARLVPRGRRHAGFEIENQTRAQAAEPGPVLLLAPVKRAPLDLIAQKATELGVRALRPVITRRTVVERLNPNRLATIMRGAAEQCGRLTLPVVEPPVTLEALVEDQDGGSALFWADESGGGAPPLRAFADPGDGAILIGPEGGFEPEERAALATAPGAVAIDLGPRVLRAETAALAAIALWQAAAGDWLRS